MSRRSYDVLSEGVTLTLYIIYLHILSFAFFRGRLDIKAIESNLFGRALWLHFLLLTALCVKHPTSACYYAKKRIL